MSMLGLFLVYVLLIFGYCNSLVRIRRSVAARRRPVAARKETRGGEEGDPWPTLGRPLAEDGGQR